MKDIQKAYASIAQQYANMVRSDDLDRPFIERFLSSCRPAWRVLDVGAGTGIVANELRKHNLKVVGIDISKEMIAIAKKTFPKIKIKFMDARDLSFPASSFDVVVANYSLIHIHDCDIPKTIHKFARVLKPKGLLYLALQEPMTRMHRDGYYPVAYNPQVKMFINLFNKKEIQRYLKAEGFKILWTDRRKPDKKTEFPFYKLFVLARKK